MSGTHNCHCIFTPIIAQSLEQWIHIDQDNLNKMNICSLHNFRTSTNKTLNLYNFDIQNPNYAMIL
jgi:hypothetical protein